jgi:anti-sigma regulatory factor (Ser/Thr protein kinase)
MHTDTKSAQFEYTFSPQKNDQAILLGHIERFAQDNALPDKLRYRLGLIVDELVTNSIVHGGCGDENQMIKISIQNRQHVLTIEIMDSGVPFDPTTYSSSRCPADGSGPLGGIGLCLVQRFAKTMKYTRRDHCNHLFISLDKIQ